ncbi:TFIIB-type zinc ribbon-containing protein [Pyrobaculum aerophilum]|uniref:Transcription initiation factor IIB, conjectural n=2 Tax=Pyrobaculum aerophilum TaxID=13773 RepID=Q8ZVU4_PYRAE|nr:MULTISPECIES: transcription initiation factor IIB family protein [Pyrobaculum]AAL63960.1 transcription initiation factor IIB, conjectural [Pyrobaculum aerophilum str. IM2]MCX8137890.1 transcription initiation factor IIB family protein [Pyrobaculum aerophilum]RFA93970.1 transcription initiation factor TFIIIB [Pyrobaculum aerophilum]RFA97209.1 transcription initiation factor TFIIIB [Pyrobaculum aerophilum]HII46483.1 transcription initiation factor IIB family protein [Pyrobaculum aerophilum]
MKCPYCQSMNITLADGEYVCRDCGTVLGPEVVPPRPRQVLPVPVRHKLIMLALEQENKKSIKKKYSEMVKMYTGKVAEALGVPEVTVVALQIFQRLDKRIYQGKSPRVIAAAVAYLAAERLGIYIHKQVIAKILGVSKFSIRDTASRLRKYVPNIKETT